MPPLKLIRFCVANELSEAGCLRLLAQERWGLEPVCPIVGRPSKLYRVKGRKSFACAWCSQHHHPMAGTIYQKTTTPLDVWYKMTSLLLESGFKTSVNQLCRDFGLNYKTAWRMKKLIAGSMGMESNYYRAAYGPVTYRKLGVRSKAERDAILQA